MGLCEKGEQCRKKEDPCIACLEGGALSQRKLAFRDITWNAAGKTWYYAEYFIYYYVFLYISCYIKENWIAFLTVWGESVNDNPTSPSPPILPPPPLFMELRGGATLEFPGAAGGVLRAPPNHQTEEKILYIHRKLKHIHL